MSLYIIFSSFRVPAFVGWRQSGLVFLSITVLLLLEQADMAKERIHGFPRLRVPGFELFCFILFLLLRHNSNVTMCIRFCSVFFILSRSAPFRHIRLLLG